MTMSAITLHLPPDTERRLREQAARNDQTVESYLEQLAERAATNEAPAPSSTESFPRFISEPRPTLDEFRQLLKDMAAGPPLPPLPPDFSRADIYDDHD